MEQRFIIEMSAINSDSGVVFLDPVGTFEPIS